MQKIMIKFVDQLIHVKRTQYFKLSDKLTLRWLKYKHPHDVIT